MHKTERASATGIVKRRMVDLCYVNERMKERCGMDKGVGLAKGRGEKEKQKCALLEGYDERGGTLLSLIA